MLGVTLVLCIGCASAGVTASDCRSGLASDSRSVEEALDSASIQDALARAWGPGAGLALAQLHWDSTGASASARVWSETLPDVVRSELELVLAAGVRSPGNPNDNVNLVLGDSTGATLRRVAEFRVCPPSLADKLRLEKRIQAQAGALGITQARRVSLLVLVNADGTAGETRVSRSSGRLDVDLAAAEVIRTALFEPGRIEGMAVRLWAAFPLTYIPSRLGGGGG